MIELIKTLKATMAAAGFKLAAAQRLQDNACKLFFVSPAGVNVEMTVQDISDANVPLAAILEVLNG